MKLSPTVRASLELLGVDAGTGPAELKKAYHRLALLYHPDRNPESSAAEEFQKVTEAYELLSDPLRVADLNRRHLRERLHRQIVADLEITFGSFFGYRLFEFAKAAKKPVALLSGKSSGFFSRRKPVAEADETWLPIEESNSILDNAAYDAIEVVYAGKFSNEDEEQLKGEVEGRRLAVMPWVVLNNQGIIRFLEGDLKSARKCYHELCERIPNNIIFMYRLGLCHILEGFQKPQRTFLGALKPDRIKVEKGVRLLEQCLRIGEERSVGRQKCLVIRKTLADVFEKTGRSRRARQLWKGILYDDPECAEAALKVKGRERALAILSRKKRQHAGAEATGERLRLEGGSGSGKSAKNAK
jgi:curved DNA-binding protein CbpA